MASYRARINVRIWGDQEFKQLSMTAQWLYFVRVTQRQASRFDPADTAQYARGLSPTEVEEAADELRQTKYGYALKKRSPRVPLSQAVRQVVFEEDGWACVWCGSAERLEVDHIIPVSRGGGNERTNLQTLCYDDNRRKGARVT